MPSRDWTDFFPFFRRKENPVASLVVLGLTGGTQALPPKRNFAQQASEGYEQNVTVFQCINLLSRACAGVPWVLMQRPSGGGRPKKLMSFRCAAKAWNVTGRSQIFTRKSVTESEIENHPLLTLIEKPNPLQGGPEYTESVMGFFLISGNSFETWVGPETGPNAGRPMEMWPLRPDRTRVIPGTPDSGVLVRGFEYRTGSGRDVFDASIVLHQKFFAPTDDFYGLSPIQVASRVIDGDNAALAWNQSLLANNARPPAALIVRGGMQDDVRERTRADIEARYSGAKNAGRPMVLEGDVDWKTLAMSPAELDWLEGRKLNAREIAKAYGVGSEFVDMDSVSYASKEQARVGLYHETILPLLDRRRDNLNNSITRRFGDGLFLDYDRDQIEALHDDTGKLYISIKSADWLSLNEKRAATGYDNYTGDPETDGMADVPVGLLKPAAAPGFGDPGLDPSAPLIDDPATKEQALSSAQRALGRKLEKQLNAHFRAEARALSAHLKGELK